MLSTFLIGVACSATWAAVAGYHRTGIFGIRMMVYLLLRSRADVRVSVAALVCLRDESGRVLLKENALRPGTLEPFGGVRLLFDGSLQKAVSKGFRRQQVGSGAVVDEAGDLRGYVNRRHLLWFRRMIRISRDVEPACSAALRELSEELGELGYLSTVPLRLSLVVVREFEQGPWLASAGDGETRYRHFTVVTARSADSETKKFLADLFAWAEQSTTCAVVTTTEIRKGRTSDSGRQIANHAQLLFEGRLTRPDRPLSPFHHEA